MENEKPVKVKNTKSIRMKRELKEKAEQRSSKRISECFELNLKMMIYVYR